MNPQQAYAIARTQQEELRRHAAQARFASGTPTSRGLPSVHLSLPRIEFGRRAAAVRAKLAES